MEMGEVEIRDLFGFTKTKPIVFKEHGFGDSAIKTQLVSDMKLVQLDSDGTIGSLDVTLEDGRHAQPTYERCRRRVSPSNPSM